VESPLHILHLEDDPHDAALVHSTLETGAEHGMWTFLRYAKWLDSRTNFFVPGQSAEPPDSEPSDDSAATKAVPPLLATPKAERKTDPSRASGAGEGAAGVAGAPGVAGVPGIGRAPGMGCIPGGMPGSLYASI